MPDKNDPVSPTRSNFREFRALIARGVRLCDYHVPNLTNKSDGYWLACVARLPRKESDRDLVGTVGQDAAPYELRYWEKWEGHEVFEIPNEPGASEFFDPIGFSTSSVTHHKTVSLAFVRLDIARFTEIPEELQPRVIGEVHGLVYKRLESAGLPIEGSEINGWKPEKVLHTGDGFVLPFTPTDRAEDPYPIPLDYAKAMASALDLANRNRWPIHFRLSVTYGETYVVGDLSGQQNYVGSAISESERLLSAMPKNLDDVVCFSYGVYQKFLKRLTSERYKFFRLGSVTDKHKKAHRLYLLEYLE